MMLLSVTIVNLEWRLCWRYTNAMPEPKAFLFVGGDPSLDLVNTKYYLDAPQPVDELQTPDDVLNWYLAAGLIDEEERQALVPNGDAFLISARQLRAQLSTLYRGLINHSGGAALEAAIEGLNAAMALGRERVTIRREGSVFYRDVELETPDLPDPVVRVAHSAGRRLAHMELRRLKQCGNTECSVIFYDDTRNASRRWCDMASCGNRLKQARFRSRGPREENGEFSA